MEVMQFDIRDFQLLIEHPTMHILGRSYAVGKGFLGGGLKLAPPRKTSPTAYVLVTIPMLSEAARANALVMHT